MECFPRECTETYYIPYTPGKNGLRKQGARGKLWSRYVNLKAAFRTIKKNDLDNKENLLNLEDNCEDALNFLHVAIEPYNKILQNWENSFAARTRIYKTSTIEKILEDFPCLATDYGIDLVSLLVRIQILYSF